MKNFQPEEPELYNLSSDPGEQNDLSKENPLVVKKLLRELETWFESVEADRQTIDDRLHSIL